MINLHSNELAAVMKTRCVTHACIFHYWCSQLELERTINRKIMQQRLVCISFSLT